MKEMKLFLVGVIFLMCFAGFVVAEMDNESASDSNDTVVVLSDVNETINESEVVNETEVVNVTEVDNETVDEVVVEDIAIEDIAIEDIAIEDIAIEDIAIEEGVLDDVAREKGESVFGGVVSYVKEGIARLNEVNGNLFLVVLVILGVLALFVFSIIYGDLSAAAYFSRASSLHRKAEKAHLNGNYERAKKLYSKSYLLREKAEGKASDRSEDGAI